ncbi:hypothetical protein ACJX0J_006042, partial [Zea mays]
TICHTGAIYNCGHILEVGTGHSIVVFGFALHFLFAGFIKCFMMKHRKHIGTCWNS